MAVLYVISAVGSALAWNWLHSCVFALLGRAWHRRFVGAGAGLISPSLLRRKWRGRLVGLFQINIVIGILLAYASNYVIAGLNSGATQWRWQLGVASVPAALFGSPVRYSAQLALAGDAGQHR